MYVRNQARKAVRTFDPSLDSRDPDTTITKATKFIMNYLGYRTWDEYVTAHNAGVDSRITPLLRALAGPHGHAIYQMMKLKMETKK